MRRIVCLFIALVMCLSIAAPVFAAENGFVPSITYKPNPEIVPVEDENGEEHQGVIHDKDGNLVDYVDHGCFRITPIAHVWDEEIEVPEYIEELLLYVYEGLNKGELVVDYSKFDADLDPADMVIRDLFDLRWFCEEHAAMFENEDNTVELIFDLGVVAGAQIYVATFDEETKDWTPIVKTVNNGDGTVTCTMEGFSGVMSFSMTMAGTDAPVDDVQTPNVWPWIILIILALIAIITIMVIKNKKKAEA